MTHAEKAIKQSARTNSFHGDKASASHLRATAVHSRHYSHTTSAVEGASIHMADGSVVLIPRHLL
jgi:hypothetical protein